MSSRPTSTLPSRGPRRRAMLRARIGAEDTTARGLLERAVAERRQLLDVHTQQLVTASQWALLHVVEDSHADRLPGREGAAQVAGEGAPLVAEFCLAELAAALGVSTDAGRALIGDAVELAHRLPLTWTALLAGRVAPYRARRIAARTAHLSAEAATHVDEQVHPLAGTLTLAALERLVTEAVARFDPDRAAAEAAAAAERRGVRIDPPASWTTDGLAHLDGALDAPDALDLDARLAEIAEQLRRLHPDASLDVRRAQALGYLARGQEVPAPASDLAAPRAQRPRQVVLHLHLSESATGPFALARLEQGRLVVEASRVAEWLGLPEATVVVKPVIDLREHLHTAAYEIPDRLREQVTLRDHGCVFPWCSRPARDCEVDHIQPYDEAGPTSTDNLAALCKRHHRHKTYGGWRYHRTGLTSYRWVSPHGLEFLRDHRGTRPVS